jgi:FkbM family methyltransferase
VFSLARARLRFAFTTFKQLLAHPSAIARIFDGAESVGAQLDLKRRERWLKHPVRMKKTKHFSIYLHLNDNAGPSASIGSDGIYEPAETDLVSTILRPSMTFVDVGANIGWYTLLAATKVGTEGRVLAFEPEPENCRLLLESIRLNGFRNVVLMQTCLYNKKGRNVLWLDPENLGAHSLIKDSYLERQKSIEVDTNTLDDALTELAINYVDVLKIDVEGAEPQVLEGAERLIKKGVNHIMMEWSASAWKGKEGLFHGIAKCYRIFRILKTPLLLKEVKLTDLLKVHKTNLYLEREGN